MIIYNFPKTSFPDKETSTANFDTIDVLWLDNAMIQTKIQINAVQEIAMNRLWTEEEYKAGGKVVNIYFFFQPFLLTNTIILMVIVIKTIKGT